MRLLVTGGSGVLGRALVPLAQAEGHNVTAPTSGELDLFDPAAVRAACQEIDAILHLATRIRPLDELNNPEAWRENDRLRADASRILVDAALASEVDVYVQPTVTFVYPADRPAAEDTPIGEVAPILRSAVTAEQETARFAQAGRRGIVLRLGLLDGPGTGHEHPIPTLGATLHVEDAAYALLAALSVPSGIYNVCRDGERVSTNASRRPLAGSRATAARPRHPLPDRGLRAAHRAGASVLLRAKHTSLAFVAESMLLARRRSHPCWSCQVTELYQRCGISRAVARSYSR